MARVRDLQPGDMVTIPGLMMDGVFIARTPHPKYNNLDLVIWILGDGAFSFDALLPGQEVGDIRPASGKDRGALLLRMLQVKRSV